MLKAAASTCERNLAEFLSKSGNKVRRTLPDGNCLFLALSVNLYNHEGEHLAVRKILVQFEELNTERFSTYLHVTTSDASNHIRSMAKPLNTG